MDEWFNVSEEVLKHAKDLGPREGIAITDTEIHTLNKLNRRPNTDEKADPAGPVPSHPRHDERLFIREEIPNLNIPSSNTPLRPISDAELRSILDGIHEALERTEQRE